MQIRCVFSPLEEGVQIHGVESLVVVQRPRLDGVVVDADPLVRVSNRDARGEVVAEGFAACGVIELREGGVVDVEPEGVGAEDEPEDGGDDAGDDEQGAQDLADAAEEAVEEAAAAAAARVASTPAAAASVAVEGFP